MCEDGSDVVYWPWRIEAITEHPSDPQPRLDATVIREALAGYALVNEVTETGRQAALAHSTREEALATWRDLMSGFNERPEMHHNLDRIDLWQVEGLLTIRRALDLAAKANKSSCMSKKQPHGSFTSSSDRLDCRMPSSVAWPCNGGANRA